MRHTVYILSLEFDKTMTETSHLLLWPILVLGAFNFFWVPLANYFGKRPVFVFASGLLCVCYIWGAVATSFNSLLWSNIVAAFAGSSTEALGAAIVNVSLPVSFWAIGLQEGKRAWIQRAAASDSSVTWFSVQQCWASGPSNHRLGMCLRRMPVSQDVSWSAGV